jgi:hypothetical protein
LVQPDERAGVGVEDCTFQIRFRQRCARMHRKARCRYMYI